MLWNNQRRLSNWFLWGMVAGVFAGLYATRWMLQRPLSSKDMNKEEQTNQKMGNELNQSVENMEQNEKQELFNTFLEGTESDLVEKSKEIN